MLPEVYISQLPLQNRVNPFGALFRHSARGTFLGSRGGRFHRDDRTLERCHWKSKRWICCVLDFKGRQREVWGRFYTELFFLDEVTAFAAGHRPCFECRRKDAEHFARLFSGVDANSAHSRASGNPELGPRLRGDERSNGARASAKTMDGILHAERLAGKAKRTHRRALDGLPDGAMVALDGAPHAVRGDRLLPWTPSGYGSAQPRPDGIDVDVLTPPSILAVLARGYRLRWHDSACGVGGQGSVIGSQ